MRHQSWVLKIDYNDGLGAGDVLWKLGYQGDFTLMNGTDPQDWFYAQHDANVTSPNSSGVFDLTVFDDGNNRFLDTGGTICGATGQPPVPAGAPILQLDEAAKTATIKFVYDAAPAFSQFGGSSRRLPMATSNSTSAASPQPAPTTSTTAPPSSRSPKRLHRKSSGK